MAKKKKTKLKIEGIIAIILIVLIGVFAFLLLKDDKKVINNGNNNDGDVVNEPKKLQIIDVDSNSRPIAVMINNNQSVWKHHSGLQDAYLVYEMVVEGGITRMMAIFKDKDTARIGSVRSSRHYFLDYALENDAVYVHFGWSTQAQNAIKSLGIDNINYLSDNNYWRDSSLSSLGSEHTAFTSIENIKKSISAKGYRNTSSKDLLLNYSIDEINLNQKESATKADIVNITYSSYQTTRYTYNATTKTYYRSMVKNGNEIKHVDATTGKQYTAKNIITYKVGNSTISGDNKNRQEIDNIGSGTGYYITNGYAVPITWEKSSTSSQTIYKYTNGEEIDVNDGNTYIQIQPSSQTLEIK